MDLFVLIRKINENQTEEKRIYMKNVLEGNVCTEFINEHEEELFSEKNPSEVDICEAIVSKLLFDENQLDRNNLFLQNDYFRFSFLFLKIFK